MSLNWKEIDTILAEITLAGSHIQKIRQPDIKTLVLDIFNPGTGRGKLFISLDPGAQRLHLLKQTPVPARSGKQQRFEQLLRARIQGGRILQAQQLGRERIIHISVRRADEITNLYIRLWGGASNIIATDKDNTILDALYRRPARGEISGSTLVLPEETNQSPAAEPDNRFTVRARRAGESFNEQIEREYRQEHQHARLQQLRKEVEKQIAARKHRIIQRLANLEKRQQEATGYETFKQTADLLAANAYRITPGESWIEVETYDEGDSETLRIALNPALSPGKNIEHYYQKYHKARGALENLREEIANTRRQLAQLDRTEEELLRSAEAEAETRIRELEAFLSAWQPVQSDTDQKREIPGLQFSSGSFTILVGRTSRENDTLLRSHTRGNDYWLHTRDYPGGYVFIKAVKGKSIPLETLLDAGNLALYYSKGRSNGKGELYYTQVKYLRRAKNGKQGLVLPTQEKNLSITLDQKRLDRLFSN